MSVYVTQPWDMSDTVLLWVGKDADALGEWYEQREDFDLDDTTGLPPKPEPSARLSATDVHSLVFQLLQGPPGPAGPEGMMGPEGPPATPAVAS